MILTEPWNYYFLVYDRTKADLYEHKEIQVNP